jgi:hypothetical protein
MVWTRVNWLRMWSTGKDPLDPIWNSKFLDELSNSRTLLHGVSEWFTVVMSLPWLRRLVASLSPQRPGFMHRSDHVGFVVDKVALERVFSEF